jgi:hypothetical protein
MRDRDAILSDHDAKGFAIAVAAASGLQPISPADPDHEPPTSSLPGPGSEAALLEPGPRGMRADSPRDLDNESSRSRSGQIPERASPPGPPSGENYATPGRTQ